MFAFQLLASGRLSLGQTAVSELPTRLGACLALVMLLANLSPAWAAEETYELRHKLQEGEVIQWRIEHLATTETRIQGNVQTSRMRTVSTRQWKVESVDAQGRMVFVQSVEDVEMVNKLSDRPELRYDSKSGEEPPQEFARVPETIGVPLAKFTIDAYGEQIKRESDLPPQDLGLGDIVMPFPKEPVKIGQVWDNPGELIARDRSGNPIRIKTRQRYCLQEVKSDVAYISVKTQVLTPLDSPRILAQIMQQMTEGMIIFDIEAGRVRKQEIDWDEEVIGFDTPGSLMQYHARYIQALVDDADETAQTGNPLRARTAASPNTSEGPVRLREDKPMIRR